MFWCTTYQWLVSISPNSFRLVSPPTIAIPNNNLLNINSVFKEISSDCSKSALSISKSLSSYKTSLELWVSVSIFLTSHYSCLWPCAPPCLACTFHHLLNSSTFHRVVLLVGYSPSLLCTLALANKSYFKFYNSMF